jgi:putative oxidoreductase
MAQAKEMRGQRSTLNAQRSTSNSDEPHSSEVDKPSAISHQPSLGWQFALRSVEFIVAIIFIYAGVIKVWDPIGFANDIDNYKMLPWAVSVRLAFYLPWLEIFCGLALITRRLYLGGLSILTALVSGFIVASIVAKARGLDITCGCFGHASKNFSFAGHLALDFGLLIGLVLLLRSSWRISVHGTGGTRAVASQE